jgi:hypothetical protein
MRHFAGYNQSGQQEPVIVGLGQKEGLEGQRLRKRVSLSSPEGPWLAMIQIAQIQAPLLMRNCSPSGYSFLLGRKVSSSDVDPDSDEMEKKS